MVASASTTHPAKRHPAHTYRTVKTTPLSHHEVMKLVAPFSRRGYAVDMEASDRNQRRLEFQPIEVEALPGTHPALRSVLLLEVPLRGAARLTRRLEAQDGPTATLVAEDRDPAALIDAVEQIKAHRQFRTIDGVLLARSYRIGLPAGDAARRAIGKTDLRVPRLAGAEAGFGPVTLLIAEDGTRLLDVTLAVDEGHRLDIPQDFLGVLGWPWRPLRLDAKGIWRGRLKPAAREPRRTEHLEQLIDQAVVHLKQTLAHTPAEFHQRHSQARWRVTFHRLLPLLSTITLTIAFVVIALALPKLTFIHILLQYVPIIALVVLAMMDKSLRIEIPPRPEPLQQSQWCPLIDA